MSDKREEMLERLRVNLPAIRAMCGWSGGDLGKMLGLSRQSICKLEKGTTKMSMAYYISIRCLIQRWLETHPAKRGLSSAIATMLDDENTVYWLDSIYRTAS